MSDPSIGIRIQRCREEKGMTQEALATKAGISVNYLSAIERGISFPRCECLIRLLNALQVSADAVFCDVVTASDAYRTCLLSKILDSLPAAARHRILGILEFLIRQESERI